MCIRDRNLSLLIIHGSIVLVLWPFRLETVRIGSGKILVLLSILLIFIQLEIVAGILFDEQSGLSSNESALTSLAVSYTHLRAHETPEHLVCRLLLEKKKKQK